MDRDEEDATEPFRAQAPRLSRAKRASPYLGASLVTSVALALCLLIETRLFVANVALVYLASVALCAARWGLGPALLASALSVLGLNFFFFPPLHDLAVDDPENVVAAITFVGAAVFVTRLTARARGSATLAERRARVTEELYAFARRLTGIDDLDQLLALTVERIASAVDVEAVLLLANEDVLAIRAGVPAVDGLEPADLAAAERCFARERGGVPGGPGGEDPASSYRFLPLRGVSRTVGVIGIRHDGRPPVLTADARGFVEAIIDQAAVGIERLAFAADVERARVTAETEGLRSAMLSAISHDLKTPLASILGAATSLGSYSSYFEQQEREELVATIREEAERMSRFVANLLDITRVEAGTLDVQHEATDIEDVIGAAARRVKRILGRHRLSLRVAADLPMLELDGVLLEQTLFNIVDNAAKYSPPGSTISIEASRMNDRLILKVVDEGPGIPPGDLKRIFEKFYRSNRRGRQRAGTGLGLAISRGFVEAMGGRIIAGNRTDRSGAVIMIGFPLPQEAEAPHLPDGDDD